MGENTTDVFEYIESLSEDQQMAFFKNMILKVLNIEDEYEVKYILDEIKNSSECANVFFHINSYLQLSGNNPSTYGNQKSDIKEKIDNAKTRIINDLKFLYKTSTLKYDGGLIKKLESEMQDIKLDMNQYEISHKEPSLKLSKNDLYEALVENCKTGKRRAKEITKIFKHI